MADNLKPIVSTKQVCEYFERNKLIMRDFVATALLNYNTVNMYYTLDKGGMGLRCSAL